MAAALAACCACSGNSRNDAELAAARAVPQLGAGERLFTLLFVGDAGEPVRNVAPIFAAIAREARANPASTAVLVLGDNVYDAGLPPEGDATRAEAVARLTAQLAPLKDSGARSMFIPGNHDWGEDREPGWQTVKRQGDYVEDIGRPQVRFRPLDACPGPTVEDDLMPGARIVALDTQWWIEQGEKPRNPGSSCAAANDSEVQAALRVALAPADGRPVILVSHHPPVSGGGHGGHFTMRDHLFPLRAWKGWLWLPLPVVGSLIPAGRSLGWYPQDAPAAVYEHMLSVLNPVLREHPPFAWAAGHEHGIQLLEGGGLARWLIVSGAGAFHHTRIPTRLPATHFASGEPGYVRLDMGRNGRGRLAAVVVEADGQAVERYAERID